MKKLFIFLLTFSTIPLFGQVEITTFNNVGDAKSVNEFSLLNFNNLSRVPVKQVIPKKMGDLEKESINDLEIYG